MTQGYDSVELDVTPAPGWRIVEWSDDRHFDGDHRDIDVYEDLDLVVYLEEIEPDEEWRPYLVIWKLPVSGVGAGSFALYGISRITYLYAF